MNLRFFFTTMAENKKGFVLYADIIHTCKHLTDEQAGLLFKHILRYVNDENPEIDNIIVNLAFEPIKQQLKRDLRKYEAKKKQWSEAGKRSAEVRKVKKKQRTLTNVDSRSTDSTVIVKDTVNVNVTVKDINNRLAEFKNSLQPFLEVYPKDMLNDFYLYWTEKKPKGRKMLFEMQKTWDIERRLKRWSDNNFNKPTKTQKKDAATILQERYNLNI